MLHTFLPCLKRCSASLLLIAAAMLGGCAVTPVQPVADWHDAVLAVQDQSNTVFRNVNDLVRASQVKRAGRLDKLLESDFQPGLDADSLAAWNRAFDGLASYGAALAALLSPDLASGVGDATKQASESLASTAKSDVLEKRPGLSSALGTLATRLTAVAAGRKASEVMAQTDGAVSDVLMQMAKMVYDDSAGTTSGVYVTVQADWMTQADEVRAQYLRATTSDEKRRIAVQFADTLQQRDAALSSILGVRAAIDGLAATHHLAAAGGPIDTAAQIARIREQTAFFRTLLADLEPAQQ